MHNDIIIRNELTLVEFELYLTKNPQWRHGVPIHTSHVAQGTSTTAVTKVTAVFSYTDNKYRRM